MKDRYESTRRKDLGLGLVTRSNQRRGWHDSVNAAAEEANPVIVMVSLVFLVAAMLFAVDQFLR